jgi:hypothetical protein
LKINFELFSIKIMADLISSKQKQADILYWQFSAAVLGTDHSCTVGDWGNVERKRE